jgi:membrane protease YdiL (CAAX protease family)
VKAAIMIWNSVRHMLFTEAATWIAFLLVATIVGSLGLRFGSEQVSAILLLVWFAIFLTAYRLKYKRL